MKLAFYQYGVVKNGEKHFSKMITTHTVCMHWSNSMASSDFLTLKKHRARHKNHHAKCFSSKAMVKNAIFEEWWST